MASSSFTVPDTKATCQETAVASLCASLGDFESLALSVSSLKTETVKREAEILKEILARIIPLVAIIGRGGESYYRRDIIILTELEDCPLGVDSPHRFFSEHKLVLYENGRLMRIHRFGESAGRDERHMSWDMTEENELSAEAAIAAFGLTAIAEGFIKAFEATASTIVPKEELDSRLKTLSTVLEVLR